MELGRRLSLKTKLKRLEEELEIYNYILERVCSNVAIRYNIIDK